MLIKTVQDTKPWLDDPSLLPIPLQIPDISQKKLRVGIMLHDGVVLPHPPVLRALNLAKEKLKASGKVDVVEYVPYKHKEGYGIIVRWSKYRFPLKRRTYMCTLSARFTLTTVGRRSANASRTVEKTSCLCPNG